MFRLELDVKEIEKQIALYVNEVISKLNSVLEVGVFGDQDSDMVIYAATNEFGTNRAGRHRNVTIPERSYIRSALDENEGIINKFITSELMKVLEGKNDENIFYNRIGLFIQKLIQEKILSNIPPGNAQSTIDRKGSSRTLIDQGRLLQSITYRIAEGV